MRLYPDGEETAMRRTLLLMFALVPSAGWPQGDPLGPEFRVNTYTTSTQAQTAVAADPTGSFVVVWQSDTQDGSYGGVFGQRYASSGAPVGPEFRVNIFTQGFQSHPSAAADAAGNFVVVWQSQNQDGSFYGVFGQRYASSGSPLGPEFRANSYTTGEQVLNQFGSSVAGDPSGNFVVVWWGSGSTDGSLGGIFGQRYASSGSPQGPEFRVNTYTTNDQRYPSVAADSFGNFVVVWQSDQQDGSSWGAFGQRYASSGIPLGPEFRVNTYTTSHQVIPAVAADSSGNFVIVWRGDLLDGSASGVFGQRYASSGIPLGPEFRVNTYTTSYQSYPAVATDASGNFVVVWSGQFQNGSIEGIFGQRYVSSGVPTGPEFRVNSYTTNDQRNPSVTSDPFGNFVVVWESGGQDGSGYGVFGQRYSQIVPVELTDFGIE